MSFAKAPPRNLARREPALPAESAPRRVTRSTACSTPYFAEHAIAPAPLVDDRRLHPPRLSSTRSASCPQLPKCARSSPTRAPTSATGWSRGCSPTVAATPSTGSRFWNDLLRNDYRGTGYIDGGRKQISAWLYAALANNMPYDQFVAALVNPGPATAGFTKGIVWRGVVNASQTPQMQAAQNISQVFMGVNLKCASCHDSFINDWQLADAYGLAAIYADGPLEMVECDQPTGKTAPMKFLYGELGTIDASSAARASGWSSLLHVLTGPKNGRLARTIVNRLWAAVHGPRARRAGRRHGTAGVAPGPARLAGRGPGGARLRPEAHDDRDPDVRRVSAPRPSDVAERPAGVRLSRARDSPDDRRAVRRRASARSPASGARRWPDEFNFALVSSHAAPPAGRVRAALVNADPLMTALGRPNREQVVTTRPAAATTLQSLELSNGATLAQTPASGRETRLAATTPQPGALVSTICSTSAWPRADARASERSADRRLDATIDDRRLEDLLWSVVMLPEFQLIR